MSEGGWEEGGRTDRPIGRRTSIMETPAKPGNRVVS